MVAIAMITYIYHHIYSTVGDWTKRLRVTSKTSCRRYVLLIILRINVYLRPGNIVLTLLILLLH